MAESNLLTKFERRLLLTAGILLILACLVVVAVGAALALGPLQAAFGSRDAVSFDPAKPAEEETFQLGGGQPLAGTSKMMFRLAPKRSDFSIEYKGGGSSEARNYLFYDYKTNEGEWLWQSRQQMVLRGQVLSQSKGFDPDGQKQEYKANYFVAVYVAKDTSADNKLDDRDKRTIRVYNIATGASKDILDDADEVTAIEQVDDTTLLVVFTGSGKTFLLVYDLEQSSVAATKVLKFAS